MKVRAEAMTDWPDGTAKGRVVEIEEDAFKILASFGAAKRAEDGDAAVGVPVTASRTTPRKPTYARRDLTATNRDQD